MKKILLSVSFIFSAHLIFAQKTATLKYPSILWEISSKKTGKKSYLFGTYHISRKNVFHLSDSFYLAIKSSDVIATESLESNWEEEFYKRPLYSPETLNDIRDWRSEYYQEYLGDFGIGSFGFSNYEKELEKKFDDYPSIIKGIISRVYNEDFSEDTYLDHYIYKLGRRLNKMSIGLENFRQSDDIVLEGTINRELDRKNVTYSADARVNPDDILDAYIKNNLDDLDSLGTLSDNSEPYREKMLYERNDIQAKQIDSFIKSNKSIFAAVGCAHLPGKRGVIETLRSMGYQLRPIIATQKSEGTNNQYKDQVVKKEFSVQQSPDKFISVKVPGKLYNFVKNTYEEFLQSVDVDNDAYFLITRLKFNYHLQGDNERTALKKLDSLFYDNIPGDILSKKLIEKNGYKGYDIISRKKTGMYQRYQVFVTSSEIIYFKSYSTESYFTKSGYVDTFFNSVQLAPASRLLNRPAYSPEPYAFFKVAFPNEPTVVKNFSRLNSRWEYYAADSINDYTVLRNFRFDADFGGNDTLDLQLAKLSYQHSFFIDSCIYSRYDLLNGRSALYAKFLHKDKSISKVCFTLKGNEYYAVIAHGSAENKAMDDFTKSFLFTNPVLPVAEMYVDTFYNFSVHSPFFYDSVTVNHRRAAYDWIQRYKGNTVFETKLKNEFSPDRIFLFNDTLGYRLSLQSNFAFSKITADAYPDFLYLKKVNNDTSLISKQDYVLMTEGLRGRFMIKSFSKKTMPDSTIEKTIIAGWPGSSRRSYIKIIELPERDQLRRISFQFDSMENITTLKMIADQYKINDLQKIPRKDNLATLLQKLVRNDTATGKVSYADLRRALINVDEKNYQDIINALQQLPVTVKDYLRIKERLLYSLSFIPTAESTDFAAAYFLHQEDTFSLKKAALNVLFAQQTAYSLKKAMQFLSEDPDADYAGADSPLSVYLKTAADKRNGDNNESDNLTALSKYADDIAKLLYESAWKDDAVKTLSMLQEKGLLRKKTLSKYLPQLLQYGKKEIRKSRTSDIRRAEAARNIDDEDNDTGLLMSNFISGNSFSDREVTTPAFIQVCGLLAPFKNSDNAVHEFFENIWQLDSSNNLKRNFLLFSLKKNLDFPDSVLHHYLTNETKAYSFIKDANRDSVDLCSRYHISNADLSRYILLKDNNPATNRNFIDSFVLVKTETIEQQDSIQSIYFYKTFPKKDKKNFAWNICKITRSKTSGKYIFRDFLKASTSYSTVNTVISAEDKEQLYLRILYDEYRPLSRFFNNVKGYMSFNIIYP
ncbi:MAG: TraB/GumN family protein [Ferruginibacter sp.]